MFTHKILHILLMKKSFVFQQQAIPVEYWNSPYATKPCKMALFDCSHLLYTCRSEYYNDYITHYIVTYSIKRQPCVLAEQYDKFTTYQCKEDTCTPMIFCPYTYVYHGHKKGACWTNVFLVVLLDCIYVTITYS